FFFSSRRRHTRFSRDWSSDVCSSDLAADKFGIDISQPSQEEQAEILKKEKISRETLKKHPLLALSRKYSDVALKFLRQADTFKEKSSELINQLELGLQTEEETEHEAATIKDCLEVVH